MQLLALFDFKVVQEEEAEEAGDIHSGRGGVVVEAVAMGEGGFAAAPQGGRAPGRFSMSGIRHCRERSRMCYTASSRHISSTCG